MGEEMNAFKKIEISPFLRQKLDSLGIVTRGILSKECRSKLELRAKFGLNDEQSDLLWNVIENKYKYPKPRLKLRPSHLLYDDDSFDAEEDEGAEQEGVANMAVADANVIDTLHGYMVSNEEDKEEQ